MNYQLNSVLIILFALAASQSAWCASPADQDSPQTFTLDIFGNANMDENIDEQDVAYINGVINGTNAATNLSDANYDGKIDEKDIAQIELIINGKEKELTVIDCNGKNVTVKKPVERVIVLGDSQADAMRILKADEKVVGIDSSLPEENILLPEMSKLPTVGDYIETDAEAILKLEPDLILGVNSLKPDIDDKVASKAAVIRLRLNGKDIEDELKILGYVLDKTMEANEFCDWYDGYIEMIRNRVEKLSDNDRPKVFLEAFPHYKPYYTRGKDSVESYICEKAGGINIAADKPSGVVDAEWVMSQNPDVIYIGSMSTDPSGYGVGNITGVKATSDGVMNRSELKDTTAVKNGAGYCTASDIVHSVQQLISISYLAKLLHPQLFKDLDPEAIHKEYLNRFQRIDYDLDKDGVFVYPPIKTDSGLEGIPDRYEGTI